VKIVKNLDVKKKFLTKALKNLYKCFITLKLNKIKIMRLFTYTNFSRVALKSEQSIKLILTNPPSQ
jgi:hypothetical protein